MSQTDTSEASPPLILMSWSSLEEGLAVIAATPELAGLAPEIVGALRKLQAGGEPPSRLMLRILCAAAFVADGAEKPDPFWGGGAMR